MSVDTLVIAVEGLSAWQLREAVEAAAGRVTIAPWLADEDDVAILRVRSQRADRGRRRLAAR